MSCSVNMWVLKIWRANVRKMFCRCRPNAFDTLSVKDGERLIQIEDRYYNLKHCRVQTSEKGEKKRHGPDGLSERRD